MTAASRGASMSRSGARARVFAMAATPFLPLSLSSSPAQKFAFEMGEKRNRKFETEMDGDFSNPTLPNQRWTNGRPDPARHKPG